ncbi:MAG: nucleotidyltransferase family protein [Candidatus Hodarchaeales archaeon]|jgi:NDP-sugar pyrophosphorylase family protein
MSKQKDIHKYTIEFTENFWLNLLEVAGHGNVKHFIIQALKVALEARTIKSLILCGGKGSSFRPLSIATPAVMFPIGYKPILEYSIDLLQKHALTDIFLSVGYHKEHIQSLFNEKEIPGVNVSFIAESKPLDTAGAVLNAQKQFKSTFLVMNGDLITNLDLNLMLQFHRRVVKEGGIATMFILEQNNSQVELQIDGNRITRFVNSGKKGLDYVNAGVYIFEPEIFEYIEKKVSSLEKDVFPVLSKEELLCGYKPAGPVYWNHINSPEKYQEGWADFLSGKLDF